MGALSGTIRINAPIGDVFAVVDDWRRTPEYLHGLERWEAADPDHARGEGSRFRVGLKIGPKVARARVVVTAYEPDVRIAFRTESGPRVSGTWTFAADGGATTVTLSTTFDLPGGVMGRVIGRAVAATGQRELDGSLRDLKRLVESA